MKKLLFALLLLCLFCTCKKDSSSNLCGGSNPVKNLPWLKAKIDTLQKSSLHSTIRRSLYQSQTIYFLSGECCPACNCVPFIGFDCDGKNIRFTPAQYNDVVQSNLLSNAQVIWIK
jgi:hypothetical protein